MRADLEWLDEDDDWPLEEPPLQLKIVRTGQKMLPEPEYAGDATPLMTGLGRSAWANVARRNGAGG